MDSVLSLRHSWVVLVGVDGDGDDKGRCWAIFGLSESVKGPSLAWVVFLRLCTKRSFPRFQLSRLPFIGLYDEITVSVTSAGEAELGLSRLILSIHSPSNSKISSTSLCVS